MYFPFALLINAGISGCSVSAGIHIQNWNKKFSYREGKTSPAKDSGDTEHSRTATANPCLSD
jgi:hypothetical protein